MTIAQLEGYILSLDQTEFAFNQRVIDSNGEISLSTGRLAYQRPDMFRLAYLAPDNVVIVSDGVQVWTYDAILNQVIISGAENSQAAKGFLAIISRDDLNTDFELGIEIGQEAQLDWLLITPFDKDFFQFENCAIGFDKSGTIAQLRLQDVLGNEIEAMFSEVTTANLDPSLFSFKIPDGAEIIQDGS